MKRAAYKAMSIEQFLDSLSRREFGRSRTESIEGSVCVTCGKSVGEFRDELSEKEYTLSGMCQECQDRVFGKEE